MPGKIHYPYYHLQDCKEEKDKAKHLISIYYNELFIPKLMVCLYELSFSVLQIEVRLQLISFLIQNQNAEKQSSMVMCSQSISEEKKKKSNTAI